MRGVRIENCCAGFRSFGDEFKFFLEDVFVK